jgi:cytochrome b561
MSIKSTPTRYGSVAIAIHWTSAIAVAGTFALGLMAAGAPDPATEVTLLLGHIVLGSLVLILTLLRIGWWIWGDRRPKSVAGQPPMQEMAAKIVHYGIYAVILLMASSGITTIILSGAGPALVAGTALPDFSEIVPRLAHGIMSKLLLVLLAAHIAAALYHQFIRRDRLLGRMGLGPA